MKISPKKTKIKEIRYSCDRCDNHFSVGVAGLSLKPDPNLCIYCGQLMDTRYVWEANRDA